METKFVYLNIKAPLQSWGDRSRFFRRDSLHFPTKSGITGLLFCAMGLSGAQEEKLKVLEHLRSSVFQISSNRDNPILTDFHMVGNGYDDSDPWQTLLIPKTNLGKKAVGGGAKITYRQYLQDVHFAVFFEIPAEWENSVKSALINPVWDIYFGRKSCAPAEPVFYGIYQTEQCAHERLMQDLQFRSDQSGHSFAINLSVKDCNAEDPHAILLYDVPLSFGSHKRYKSRFVQVIRFSS